MEPSLAYRRDKMTDYKKEFENLNMEKVAMVPVEIALFIVEQVSLAVP